jgi:hypothetical protein
MNLTSDDLLRHHKHTSFIHMHFTKHKVQNTNPWHKPRRPMTSREEGVNGAQQQAQTQQDTCAALRTQPSTRSTGPRQSIVPE